MTSTQAIRREAEQFMEEVMREEYLFLSGQKDVPAYEELFARHKSIIGADAVAAIFENFSKQPRDSEARRQDRMLLEWLVKTLGIQAMGPVAEEESAWLARAIIRLGDGREIPYPKVTAEITNENNAAKRRELDDARAKLVGAELNVIRVKQLQRERSFVASLGIEKDYVRTYELLGGISLTALRSSAQRFLHDSESLWDRVRGEVVPQRLGIEPARATRADALALFREHEFDALFPSQELFSRLSRATAGMGFDPLAGGRIRLDTEVRERKMSRPFCAPVRVPDEVYLVTSPIGGQGDWRNFLHEMGHALHFANTDRRHPVEYRYFGDNAVTETFAFLFDHLLHDDGWLRQYTDVGTRAGEFTHSRAIEELHHVRRNCGRLLYEMELYSGAVAWEDLPGRYVSHMSRATGFVHRPEDAFVDVDYALYVVAYLRAQQFCSVLCDALVGLFGSSWWSNPKTADWMIRELFSHGSRETADELAQRVTGQPLSFAPLTQSLEARLA
jgi:hypothetical protein